MIKPDILYIETTNHCNAACVMCPNRIMRRRRGFMSDAVFEQTMRRCVESGWKNMQVFMHKEGEPLLDRKIAQRVAEAKKRLDGSNKIALNTNAMLLDENMAKAILSSDIDEIYFSLDGIDAGSYGKIRINLDYDTVVKNIKNFFRLRRQINIRVKVVMQMLVDSDSSPHIPVFIEQWGKYDCEIYIKRIHSYLDGGHSSMTVALSAKQINICEDPNRILVIYIDGNTGLCCWDYNNEYSPGSIFRQSLNELFNNKKAYALRDALVKYKGDKIAPCRRCARIFGNDIISPPNSESASCKTK